MTNSDFVPMVERLAVVRDALQHEAQTLRRELAARQADAIRAADERRALEHTIGRRAIDNTNRQELFAQYADAFAEFDARIYAPAEIEQRLSELPAEIARIEAQIPVTDRLHQWGTRR